MYYNEDYLAHYGVKGMKWGVRKAKAARAAVGRAVGRIKSNRAARVGQQARNRAAWNRMSEADRLRNLHLLDDGGQRARRVALARKAATAGIAGSAIAAPGVVAYKVTENQRRYRKQTRERLKRKQQT